MTAPAQDAADESTPEHQAVVEALQAPDEQSDSNPDPVAGSTPAPQAQPNELTAPTPAAELEVIPVPQIAPEAPVVAEAPPKPGQIEDIVVTAQKRKQFAQDVPVSMTVMNDTFIKAQGITTVKDALLFVPNFKVVEVAGRVSPQCRGFTVSDGNPAFEAPCGLALDGVSFSRGSYFSAGLLDLKRIEVLRGPQGTTFGKNTTAGVVALYTKDPTDVFVGNVDLQYGLNGPGPRRAELGVGGPLIPGFVNFRIAGSRELRDPFMENTYHRSNPSVSEDVGDSQRIAYRVKLDFPDLFGADLMLLHEHTNLFSNGYPVKLIPLTQSYGDYIHQYDPDADFGENYKTSNRGNRVWTETTRNQAELNFFLLDWTFTGVGGFGELVNRQDLGNAVPSPLPLGHSLRGEQSPYITGELRAVSPDFDGLLGLDSLFGLDLGKSNLLLGVFGQQQELKKLTIDVDVSYAGVAIILLSGVDLPLPITPPIGTIFSLLEQQGVDAGESYHILFGQKANTAALFGQLTWDFSDDWSLGLSGRVSEESKDGHWNVSYSVPAPLFNNTGNRGFIKDKTLDSSSFQPKVSLSYKLTESINLFAHWARAYKSGGFNAYTSTGDPENPNPTNLNATPGSLTYDDETGTDWGFDIKTRLFDNTMQLNLSLFRLDVKNFQVLTEVIGTQVNGTPLPNGYQQVVNAGAARAQGVEMDATWLATDWLTFLGAVGYNDTEYLSFPLDNCASGEDPNPDTGRCDHTGKPFKDTPKLSGTLSLDTHFPLGGLWSVLGDTKFLLGGTAEYTGAYFSGGYRDFERQEARFLYRAHAGFANSSQGWSLRATMLNITNEYGKPTGDPEGPSLAVAPIVPRSVFAQFSWSY